MRSFVRKALYFSLFFIVFTLILNSAYLAIITRTDWNFAKRIESMRWENPDFELLAFGTSLADYGVDAELLTENGMKSYNLALVGGSLKTTIIQLEEYLTNYEQAPKYVLLLLNSYLEDFDQTGIQPVVEFTMKKQKIDFKDIPISKFQWQTHELLKKAFSKEYRSGYISYGQTRRKSMAPDLSDYQDRAIDIEKYRTTYWIGELARLCNENDILLYLIDIPAVKETQNSSDIGPYTLSFDNNSTAELYNLNSQEFCKFIDDQKDWVGLSHFNEYGAAKFTEELFHIINAGN